MIDHHSKIKHATLSIGARINVCHTHGVYMDTLTYIEIIDIWTCLSLNGY